MPDCHDCQVGTQENAGRWVILGEKEDGLTGFLCVSSAFGIGEKEDWSEAVILPKAQ